MLVCPFRLSPQFCRKVLYPAKLQPKCNETMPQTKKGLRLGILSLLSKRINY